VALKLTTARYYVPSGRSIQKPSRSTKHPERDENGDLVETEPSDDEIFYTNGGRKVFGGGGIVPDVHIDDPSWTPLEINLWRQGKFFNFAVHYTNIHPDIGMDFEVTPTVLQEFENYLEEKEFDYKTETQMQLEGMREELEDDPERMAIYEASLASIEELIDKEKDYNLEQSTDFIKREIKRAVLSKQFGQRGFYEGVVVKNDEHVRKAIEILTHKDEYSRLLSKDHDDQTG
jgi:carboxyl-terminal processing protease